MFIYDAVLELSCNLAELLHGLKLEVTLMN